MPDDAVSFVLKKTVKDFNGGSVVVGDKVVNLKTRLGESGVITTSDPLEIAAFGAVDVLKEGDDNEVPAKAAAKTSGDSAGKE